MSVELDGEVGCYNLLVRAVPMCREMVVDVADSLWSYVAQELRSVASIDGSLMQMILTHRSTKQSSPAVCRSPGKSGPHDKSVSVRTLLQQFPTLLPASLSQLSADPTALLDVHRKCVANVFQITCTNEPVDSYTESFRVVGFLGIYERQIVMGIKVLPWFYFRTYKFVTNYCMS